MTRLEMIINNKQVIKSHGIPVSLLHAVRMGVVLAKPTTNVIRVTSGIYTGMLGYKTNNVQIGTGNILIWLPTGNTVGIAFSSEVHQWEDVQCIEGDIDSSKFIRPMGVLEAERL